ncbi:MAG: PilZ domain-containing protein [Acidobacteria bacterium]|nr:PilZ domain-containing protein [Acidobacteriota bacterium]MBI3656028.1 PilZ domain-containing protein [Acidobacteriota bacterium]
MMVGTLAAEKRRHKRLALLNEIMVMFSGRMDKRPTRLLDISSGGLFIDCMLPPPVGTIVDLKFNLQGYEQPIEAQGQVRFKQDGLGMGVQFTRIDPDVQAYIESLLAHIEKAG